jgi:hypothetical protein
MEVTMCYSRGWDTTERRKQQEAEAQRKRDGVIKTLLTDADKAAQVRTEKPAAKVTAFSNERA